MPLQPNIQDASNPLNLLHVPLFRAWEILRMELLEPISLAEIWTLSRGLEHKPLVEQIFLGNSVVGERTALVVILDQVLDDGA